MVFRRRRPAPRHRKKFKRRALRRLGLAPEVKYATLALSSTFSSVGTTPLIYEITSTSQGTGANGNRIGSKIFAKSILIDGCWTSGDSSNVMRIAVLEVNEAWVPGDWALDAYETIMKGNGLKRILYDGYHTVNRTVTGADVTKRFKKYIRLNKTCRYEGTNTVPRFGRVVLVMVSDSAGVPNPGFVNGFWRLTYTDT